MKKSVLKSALSVGMSLLIASSSFTHGFAANKTMEGDVAVIPNVMMSVSANSSNASYLPSNAVDGDVNTIWHSEWTPANDPFPHIFTISLCHKLTLDRISILPRQDADAGKTTSGQIYAGDSLDDMTLVTAFTGDASRNATVVDLGKTQAKYIQIYSLNATSANTAIAEIELSTSDRFTVDAFSAYYEAYSMLQKATVGDQAGDYTQADVDQFQKQLEQFLAELNQDGLSDSEYQGIGEKITTAMEQFAAKAKVYTREDLKSYMDQLTDLKARLTAQEDKTAAEDLLGRANGVYEDSGASKQEIHQIVTDLIDFIKAVQAIGQSAYDLSGEWGLDLAGYSDGLKQADTVKLPGTLDSNKKGTYNSSSDINRLSRLYKYTGPATYQKEIYISKTWEDQTISLYMERSRETRVWVNDVEVTSENRNLLPVSQSYDLTGQIRFGQYNTIAIQVDNSYTDLPAESILRSHMATDETQTNWNGILGKFQLNINNKVFIEDMRVYPNSDLSSVRVQVDVKNTSGSAYNDTLTLSCPDAADRKIQVGLAAGETKTVVVSDYAMPSGVKLWSEFDTPLYQMTASLANGGSVTESFGMRRFDKDADTATLSINGDKAFLRNETNCAVFPLTGYAPMDQESWETLFKTYQSYGINSVRFHSWCPPEAAFYAADKLGLYLQPELSCWDGGMLDNDVKRNYYSKEAYAIVKEYANHPSFVMLSFGNELSYSQENYQYADQLIQGLKEKDSTRLYAPGSNIGFGGTSPSPNADFFTAQHFVNKQARGSYGGLDGFTNQAYPSSEVNFDEIIEETSKYQIPFFNFEVGQYQVFPDVLTEPGKYNGVFAPRNFDLILDKIEENGISKEEIEKTINASGMLARLAYKGEIEAALRTKGMSGISLLGIQDFCGQGTALVGMVNALGETKPYDFADPKEFSSFFSPVTVLFESQKFTYTNNETLTGNLLLSNYAQDDLRGAVAYKLTDSSGKVVFEGTTDAMDFKQGKLTNAGKISIPLNTVKKATQLTLEVSCLQAKNKYNIWVYPDEGEVSSDEVYVTDYLDDKAEQILAEGGKVFISPRVVKTAFPDSREGRFSTAFWSIWDTSQPGTMGLLVDPSHPLFQNFPTDFYSDYQWWAMSRYGRPMNLETLKDKAGNCIQPLVKVLDGFENLENLGLLYEAKVGNGKVIVSSMNLENLKYEYPEAMALRNAILRYMESDAFNPKAELDIAQIKDQVKETSANPDNLALGKNVFDSDAINAPEWAAENLVDGLTVSNLNGNGIYGYSSNCDYPLTQTDCNAGFIVDLGRAVEFNKVVLYPRTDVVAAGTTNGAASFPRTFEIQASNDRDFSTYDTLLKQSDVTTTIDQPLSLKFDSTTKRYIRVLVTQVGTGDAGDRGRVQLAEFEVYNEQTVPQPVPVTGVMLNKSKITLPAGESEALTATVKPENATNKAVTWVSTDEKVATVDAGGNVKAVSAGTAVIQVTTADGGFTASCTVTVEASAPQPVPVTGVALNKSAITLPVGGSENLTATVKPENATNKAVTWVSTDEKVATVDAGGNVKAVSPGTAIIRITTADGGFTASCIVTVEANSTPSEPENPGVDSKPEVPNTPSEPETPGADSEPEVPSTPSDPETPSANVDAEAPKTGDQNRFVWLAILSGVVALGMMKAVQMTKKIGRE